jgi:hypothetical protein
MWIAAAALAGCGLLSTSPCDKADQAVQALADKTRSCSGLSLPSIKGKSACETAIKNCNDVEKTVISDEMDCITNLSACVAGKESDWVQSLATCTAPTAALSQNCKQGFGL